MAAKSVTFRLDETLKKQAEIIFDSMGLNMSTALQIFITQAVSSGSLPFKINADETAKYKAYVLRALAESKKEAIDSDNIMDSHDDLIREWAQRRSARQNGVQAFYHIEESGRVVVLHRVIHGAMDLVNQLNDVVEQ